MADFEKVGISLKGTLSSEKGFHDGYEIYMAYRSIETGRFELISRAKLDLSKVHFNQLGLEEVEFEIFGEGVTLHGEGKEIVLVFNGKYRTLSFYEKELYGSSLEKTELKYMDLDSENKDPFTDDFIENSISKATDPYFDPMVQNYINSQTFARSPENAGMSEQEYLDYVDQYGSENAINILLTREKEIRELITSGKTKKEIFNYVFDKTNLKEVFEQQGYSSQDINNIRDKGMNGSILIIQKNSIPEEIKKINDSVKSNKLHKISDNLITGDKPKKDVEIVTVELKKDPAVNKEIVEQLTGKKYEESGIKGNEYQTIFILGFLLIFFVIIFYLIKKYLKKKRDEYDKNEFKVFKE